MTRTPAIRLHLNNPRPFLFCAALTGALLLGGAMHTHKGSSSEVRPNPETSLQAPRSSPVRPGVKDAAGPVQRPAPGSPKLRRPDAIARFGESRGARAGGSENVDANASSVGEGSASKGVQAPEAEEIWPNLVKNSSFENSISGWSPFGGSEITRIGGGFQGSYSLEMRGPARVGLFGVMDGAGWVPRSEAAGTRYRASVWVRSAVHKGHALMRIRETVKDAEVGTMSYASVALSPAWQLLALEYVSQKAGSRLDLQILDDPKMPGEVFQTDNVVILMVPKMPVHQMKDPVRPEPHGDLTRNRRQVGSFLFLPI